MTTTNQNYKQTDIGIIPEDWKVRRLGEIADIKMGQSPLSEFYNDQNVGLPLVQGNADIKNRETIIRSYTSKITKQAKIGDIIMSVRAPVGEIARATFDCCIGRGVCAIDYKNNYLFHYLIDFENSWSKISTGSTFDSINSTEVKNLQIPLPPLPEQIAIATVLSDTDELITSLTHLIAKKKLIKIGTMQKLLKPQDGWEVKKLGEICEIKKGKGISKSAVDTDGRNKCILYGELFTKYKEVIKTVISRTNFNESILSKEGDILFPGSTTTTGIDLAKASVVLEENVLLGGDIIILRKTNYNYNPVFLSYYLNIIKKYEIAQSTKGITIHHLYGSDLAVINAHFPPLSTQTQIATILTDMDDEIQALESKLSKYRLIKQGMMQELLTGRIRLV
jgi:type I restriction enzyme, S subunit